MTTADTIRRFQELARNPKMVGALLESINAMSMTIDALMIDVPEGSSVPPWIVALDQARERAIDALNS